MARRPRKSTGSKDTEAPAKNNRRARNRKDRDDEIEAEEDVEMVGGGLGAVSARSQLDRVHRASAGMAGGESGDEDSWMTTYTDMVTLLLTCLIMLITMATFTETKEDDVATDASIAEQIVRESQEKSDQRAAEREAQLKKEEELEAAKQYMPDSLVVRQVPDNWTASISRKLEKFVKLGRLSNDVSVEKSKSTVRITFNNNILFPSGSVDLEAQGTALVGNLAPLLREAPGVVMVEGHTDNVPINNWLFPSNWELSAARASAVVRSLVGAGMPAENLSVVGRADTEPIADNATAEGREENRRVVIVLSQPQRDTGLYEVPPPEQRR